MPQLPGLMVAPTVVFNAVVGLAPEREVTLRGPDRLAVVLPMFDEEGGAEAALLSVLAQRSPADAVVVSINGGSDRTGDVVAGALRRLGYRPEPRRERHGLGGRVTIWRRPARLDVTVVEFHAATGKAECLNAIVEHGIVGAERVLAVDGDTVLDPGFIGALRDGFYRARLETREGRRRWVVEDVALQSGAATSRRPARATPVATLVSCARDAEYAFSAVLRSGQTRRLGASRTFGRTRLYTVVGCGFSLRRDAFPIPMDTLTEDHDLTLAIQADDGDERSIDVESLAARGFEVVAGGRVHDPRAFFGAGETLTLLRGGGARFVTGAVMHTEDPSHLGGYVRQVERWTGGGLQNALKRTVDPSRSRALAPNVRFAMLSAQLENLFGLALLAYLPIWLGMRTVDPGSGLPFLGLALWLAIDLTSTALVAAVGFVRLERSRGARGRALVGHVIRGVAVGVVPLVALKYVHAVCYVTAASRVVPAYLLRAGADRGAAVTWVRPHRHVRKGAHARTVGVGVAMASYALVGFVAVVSLAAPFDGIARETGEGAHSGAPIEYLAYLGLPVQRSGPALVPYVARSGTVEAGVVPVVDLDDDDGPAAATRSQYCPPHAVAVATAIPRSLSDDAGAFEGLSPWGVLTLARLVPVLAHVEAASTAYDVPPRLLLQVLLNESFLDPLAHGPTDDVGMSQVTADALALLRALATDPDSGFANPLLVGVPFTLYDPDFSICAGAAKLAWARAQPGGADDGIAYARYVNPSDGVVDGRVSARHAPIVAAFEAVRPLALAMSAVVAAYRADPEAVGPAARSLLAVADGVAAGAFGLEGAYRMTADLVTELGVDDAAFYAAVVRRLYTEVDADVATGTEYVTAAALGD
jgi:cellulose synthase/poly-beta-1,6-N-acetylglucosamine synthase-like glycosyltransferase